ncbi:unnamed protein product [Prunus armeniaca]|uniref:Uncharacterized protein n=1 Tax=Prunus armeniaca TaxID=36596 RepID=A0A6J5WWP9_PRUAR|nr:unnamed protein product [Prunus armeniaca]CAB4302798.1 unnamed protein product [Prunus armeniaca]
MPQHQGGQVTTQEPTPVQTNPRPSASANTIRACTAARREMPNGDISLGKSGRKGFHGQKGEGKFGKA